MLHTLKESSWSELQIQVIGLQIQATSRIQRRSCLGACLAVTSQKSLDVLAMETRSIHAPILDLPLVLGRT